MGRPRPALADSKTAFGATVPQRPLNPSKSGPHLYAQLLGVSAVPSSAYALRHFG